MFGSPQLYAAFASYAFVAFLTLSFSFLLFPYLNPIALIHDCDHHGLTNEQLAKENPSIADLYKNKSVAEQHSVDLAWDLLMEPDYADLRACIYSTEEELKRFRQLMVCTVMATDVMDKELNAERRARWAKAFDAEELSADGGQAISPAEKRQMRREAMDRKATIVIEHLIQASDVAHTMQHWHVYIKW